MWLEKDLQFLEGAGNLDWRIDALRMRPFVRAMIFYDLGCAGSGPSWQGLTRARPGFYLPLARDTTSGGVQHMW